MRNTLRGLKKVLLCSLIVVIPFLAIWVYIACNPLGYMDEEAPHYIWNRETVRNDHTDYNVVILGDSIMNADILPDLLSEKTINLAMGGASVVESWYVLQEYLESHPAPKVIYIGFRDEHLYQSETLFTRSFYTHRFTASQAMEMFSDAEKYNEDSIWYDGAFENWLEYQIWFPSEYMTSFLKAGINGRGSRNHAALASDTLHRGVYLSLTSKTSSPDQSGRAEQYWVDPMYEAYYRKILSLAEEKQIQVRIVMPSAAESVFPSDNYFRQQKQFYDSLLKDYPGVSVFYSPNVYPDINFSDHYHMNMHGAIAFTKDLKQAFPQDFETEEASDKTTDSLKAYMSYAYDAEDILSLAENTPLEIIACVHRASLEENRNLMDQIRTFYPDAFSEAVNVNDEWEILYLESSRSGHINVSTMQDEDSMIEISTEGMENPVTFSDRSRDLISMIIVDKRDGSIAASLSLPMK